MQRRHFLEASFLPAYAQVPPVARETQGGGTGSTSYQVQIEIERRLPGRPHRGKVLAAIQPHCDDIPIFTAGTVLKMVDEGYTAYLITTSDDSMAGTGSSYGDIVLKNERDTREVARRMGCKDAFFLGYPNHNMDIWPIAEMRARLVFLFRALKVASSSFQEATRSSSGGGSTSGNVSWNEGERPDALPNGSTASTS